jgi:hypothetical protein
MRVVAAVSSVGDSADDVGSGSSSLAFVLRERGDLR